MYVTVTLFSRDQCYREHMGMKMNEPDEYGVILTAIGLQYL